MNMQKYVTELQPADVLFGRGSGPNDHEGNVRFRQYVAERKVQYMATNHRLTKTKIAREIVDLVLQGNGRFLRKIEGNNAESIIVEQLGLPEGSECYELVDDDTVMEKAKQALRQNAAKVRGDMDGTTPTAPTTTNTQPAQPSSSTIESGYHHPQQPPFSSSRQDPATTSLSSLYDLEPLPLSAETSTGSLVIAPYNGETATTATNAARMVSPSERHHHHGGFTTISSSSGWGDIQPPGVVMGASGTSTNSLPQAQQQRLQPASAANYAYAMPPEQQQHIQYNHPGGGLLPPQPSPHTRFVHNEQQQRPPSSNQQQQQQLPFPSQQQHQQTVHFQQPSQRHVPPIRDFSMGQLPNDDDCFRTSMTMSDLMKIHMKDHSHRAGHRLQHQQQHLQHQQRGGASSNVDELMDSFSQMRTGSSQDYDQRRSMNQSSETMGTIEPMGSVADMSIGTMGSSIFSVFRGGDSLAVLNEDAPLNNNNDQQTMTSTPGGSTTAMTGGGASGTSTLGSSRSSSNKTNNPYESTTSLSFTDALFDSNLRKSSSLSASINGMLSDVRRQVESEYPSAGTLPRTVAIMEEASDELRMETMGASSIEILKSAFTNPDEDDDDDDNDNVKVRAVVKGD